MSKKNKEKSKYLAEMLISEFLKMYKPVISPEPDIELKTTIDLMQEISVIIDMDKKEVANAMYDAGFKTTYTEAGFSWMMKRL